MAKNESQYKFHGFHFSVDVMPNWRNLLDLIAQKAESLKLNKTDVKSLFPKNKNAYFFGTKHTNYPVGGLSFSRVTSDFKTNERDFFLGLRTSKDFQCNFGMQNASLLKSTDPALSAMFPEDDLSLVLNADGLSIGHIRQKSLSGKINPKILDIPIIKSLDLLYLGSIGKSITDSNQQSSYQETALGSLAFSENFNISWGKSPTHEDQHLENFPEIGSTVVEHDLVSIIFEVIPIIEDISIK